MNLIAGHDTIEFGWNVCTWIPYVRYISSEYEKVVIACNPVNRYLYEDFATEFIDYTVKNVHPDMYYSSRHPNLKPKLNRAILDKFEGYKYVYPKEKYCERGLKKFFKYGDKKDECAYDVVIHARAENKYGQGKLNYSPRNYEEIVKKLEGLKICSVGTRAYHIEKTVDKRGICLKELCDIFASSKVVVGTSSGPLHLASLCGCPQVILTGNSKLKSINGTNRDRYERLWNPFGTAVTVLDKDNWHPLPVNVFKALEKYL